MYSETPRGLSSLSIRCVHTLPAIGLEALGPSYSVPHLCGGPMIPGVIVRFVIPNSRPM